jgi:hypothetical protein
MTTIATAARTPRTGGFELRAHAKQAPQLWHITRTGDDLALCGKHLPDPAATRPASHIDDIPDGQHCRVCWPSYRSTLTPPGNRPVSRRRVNERRWHPR